MPEETKVRPPKLTPTPQLQSGLGARTLRELAGIRPPTPQFADPLDVSSLVGAIPVGIPEGLPAGPKLPPIEGFEPQDPHDQVTITFLRDEAKQSDRQSSPAHQTIYFDKEESGFYSQKLGRYIDKHNPSERSLLSDSERLDLENTHLFSLSPSEIDEDQRANLTKLRETDLILRFYNRQRRDPDTGEIKFDPSKVPDFKKYIDLDAAIKLAATPLESLEITPRPTGSRFTEQPREAYKGSSRIDDYEPVDFPLHAAPTHPEYDEWIKEAGPTIQGLPVLAKLATWVNLKREDDYARGELDGGSEQLYYDFMVTSAIILGAVEPDGDMTAVKLAFMGTPSPDMHLDLVSTYLSDESAALFKSHIEEGSTNLTETQLRLITQAKKEAVDKGDYPAATIYDPKTGDKLLYLGLGEDIKKGSKGTISQRLRDALEKGVLNYGELVHFNHHLNLSGLGKNTHAESILNGLQLAELYEVEGISSMLAKLTDRVIKGKYPEYEAFIFREPGEKAMVWDKPGDFYDRMVVGDPGSESYELLSKDPREIAGATSGNVSDFYFRKIQRELLIKKFQEVGDEESIKKLSSERDPLIWIEAIKKPGGFIDDDDENHKWSLKRLRQLTREMAVFQINEAKAFYYDPKKPSSGIRVTELGNPLVDPRLMYRRSLFEDAVNQYQTRGENPLSEEQMVVLHDRRERYMELRAPDIEKLLSSAPGLEDTHEAWEMHRVEMEYANTDLPKGEKKTRVDILDGFLGDDDNYEDVEVRLNGLGWSVVTAGTGLLYGPMMALGSEWAAQKQVANDKEAQARKEYAQIFGGEMGWKYDVASGLVQVAADIAATVLLSGVTAGGITLAIAAKHGAGLTARGMVSVALGRALAKEVGESTGAAMTRSNLKSLLKKSGDAKSILGLEKAMVSYNKWVGSKLLINSATFLTSANRSFTGSYATYYAAQPDDMSHAEKHDRALGPAMVAGFATGLITVGFNALGRGGVEGAVHSNMSWAGMRGVLKGIMRRDIGNVEAKLLVKAVVKRKLSQLLGMRAPKTLFKKLLKSDAVDEFWEETVDGFVSTFVDDWALDQNTSWSERINSSLEGGRAGFATAMLIPAFRSGARKLRGINISDPSYYESEQIRSIAEEVSKELQDTGSPMTAEEVRRKLEAAAGAVTPDTPMPEARAKLRVPQAQRLTHLTELQDAVKDKEIIQGTEPFDEELPQITDPELLKQALDDENYNVTEEGVIRGVRDTKTLAWVGFKPVKTEPSQGRKRSTIINPEDINQSPVDEADLVDAAGVETVVGIWADANRDQLNRKNIRLKSTDLNKGDPTGVETARATIDSIDGEDSSDGEPYIEVDFNGLARRLAGLDPDERYDTLNSILGEELIHAAEIIQFKLEWSAANNKKKPSKRELQIYAHAQWEAMYDSMDHDVARSVVEAYMAIPADQIVLPHEATAEKKATMSAMEIAAEHNRMLIQYEETGTITEAQWISSDKIAKFFRALHKRISRSFLGSKIGFVGPVREGIRKHADRIMVLLTEFNLKTLDSSTNTSQENEAVVDDALEIDKIIFEGVDEDGKAFKRDWAHVGNTSKKWTSRGKKRDGATRVHRDRKYKIVRNVVDVSDVTKDTYELINLETQQSEGVFEGPFEGPKAAEAKHKELTSKPDPASEEDTSEESETIAITKEDTAYLNLIKNQKVDENKGELQKMVFEAHLTPEQISAIEAHADAIASGDPDAIMEARDQMADVGLGDVPAQAVQNISDQTEALSSVLRSLGINPAPIIKDPSGNVVLLSERAPLKIISLSPDLSGDLSLEKSRRALELIQQAQVSIAQWGVEVKAGYKPPVNRGAMWSEEGKVFINPDEVALLIEGKTDAEARTIMDARVMAQVAVAQSYEEHSQSQINKLSEEISDGELETLVEDFYPEDLQQEARNRLAGTSEGGSVAAGVEVSFLVRQKIANETSLILQGETAASVDAFVANHPTFKESMIRFMKRVGNRLFHAKRKRSDNPHLSIMINTLVDRMKAYRGAPRAPRKNFDASDPQANLDLAQDVIEGQAPMSDESKVDTKGFKTDKEALAHVANSNSRFALVAQHMIDTHSEKYLSHELGDIPEEASPSQILRYFLRGNLELVRYSGMLNQADVNTDLTGQKLHDALTKMVTDARAAKETHISEDPDLDLWEVYLSLVEPQQMSLSGDSQHSFYGFLNRMLSDPWVQSHARQDTVGFTNSWDKFTKAATSILNRGGPGDGLQKADVLDIIDSSLEDVDFAPQEDPPIGFQPLGTSNASRSTLEKLKAEFGDDPRRHLQQLDDAVSRAQLDWEVSWPPGTKAYSVIEDRMNEGVASLYEAYNKVYEFFGNPVEDNLNKSIELARKEPKFNEEVARLASMNVSDNDIKGATFSVGHSAFKAFIDGSISATEFWEQYVVQQTWSYEDIFSKETFQELMELHDLRLDPLNPKPLFSFNAEGLPQLSSNIQRIALESKDKDRRQLAWNTLRARRWLSGEDQIEDFTPLGTSNAERTSIEVRLAKRFGEDPLISVYSNMAPANVIHRELLTLYRQAARDPSNENLSKISEKEKQLSKARVLWGNTARDLFEAFSVPTPKELMGALSQTIWENSDISDYAPQLVNDLWAKAAAGLPEGTEPQISILVSEIKKVIAETPAGIRTEDEFDESALLPYLARPDAPVLVVKPSQVAADETLQLIFSRWALRGAMADAASWSKNPRMLAAADLKSILEDFLAGKLQYPARALNLSGDDPADAGLKNIAIKLYKVMKFLSGDGISEDPYMNLIGIGWDDLRKIESRLANDLGATTPPREHIGNLLDDVVKHSKEWFEVAELVPDEAPTSGPEATVELTKEADMALAAISSAREAILKAHSQFGNSTKEIISDMKAVIAGASDRIQRAYKKEIELVDGFFGEYIINVDPSFDPEGVATEELGKILERLGLGLQDFKERVAIANFTNGPALDRPDLGGTEAEKATFRKLKLLAAFTSTANFFNIPYSGITFARYFDRLQSATRVRAGDFEPESLTHLRVWERAGMGALSPLELEYSYPQDYKSRRQSMLAGGLRGLTEDHLSQRVLREALQSEDSNIRQRAINYLNAFDYLRGPTAKAPDIDLRASGASRRGPDREAQMEHIRSLGVQTPRGGMPIGERGVSIVPISQLGFEGDQYVRFKISEAFEDAKDISFDELSVPPDLRGRGIASALLKEIIKKADEVGATLRGHAKPFHPKGLTARQLVAFYERHGFQPEGVGAELVGDQLPDTIEKWVEDLEYYDGDVEVKDKEGEIEYLNANEVLAKDGYEKLNELVDKMLDAQADHTGVNIVRYPETPDIDLRASGASPHKSKFGNTIQESVTNFSRAAKEALSRTSYGEREVTAVAKQFAFVWSDGSEEWVADNYLFGKSIKKGGTYKLDANQILATAKNLAEAKTIAKHLPPLPLYGLSHEATRHLSPEKTPWEYERIYNAWEYGIGSAGGEVDASKNLHAKKLWEDFLKEVDSNIFPFIDSYMDEAVGPTPDIDLRASGASRRRGDLWGYPAAQEFSSADTSINEFKLPATFGNLATKGSVKFVKGGVNADIGGGKFDNGTEFLADEYGVTNLIFDPFNRTPEHNANVVSVIAGGGADTATVNNVLNIIKEQENRLQVIRQAANAIGEDGVAYFLIYKGDESGVGRETTQGKPPRENRSWQNNQKASYYLDEVKSVFGDVVRKGDLLIASNPHMDEAVGPTPDIDLRASGASRNRFGASLPHTTKPFDKFIGGLTVAADGTLPKEPLRAQVAKRSGLSREARDLINAFIDLSPGDRVNATELVKAVELRGSELLETKTRIVKAGMSPEEFDPELADVMHPNRLQHEMETRQGIPRGLDVLQKERRSPSAPHTNWTRTLREASNLPPDSELSFALNDVNDDSNISSLHREGSGQELQGIESGSPDTNPLLEGSPLSKEGRLERFLNGFPFRIDELLHSTGGSLIPDGGSYSDLVGWKKESGDKELGFTVRISPPPILHEAVSNPETQQLVRDIARDRGISDYVIRRHMEHTPPYRRKGVAIPTLELLARSLVSKLQSEGVLVWVTGSPRDFDETVHRYTPTINFTFPLGFTPEQLQADLLTLGVLPDVARLFSEFDRSFPKVADKWGEYLEATKPTISQQVESVNPKLPKDMEDFGHSLLYAPEGGMKDQFYFEEAGYKANQLMGWTRHYVDEGVPVAGEDKTPIKGRVVYEVQSSVGQELAKQEKQLRENYGVGIQDVAEDFENWLEGRPLKNKGLDRAFFASLGDEDSTTYPFLMIRDVFAKPHSLVESIDFILRDWVGAPAEGQSTRVVHQQIKQILEEHPELLPSYNKLIDKIKKKIKKVAAEDTTVYPFLIDGKKVRKHPLIRHTDRLSLQLALAEAREAGHSHLMIVDAETAMQVQGHDKQGGVNWAIPQEAGMRAAYDGKLVDILVKLTGDKGTRVDLGKGQHTSPIFKNLDGTPKNRVTAIAFAIPDALPMGLFSRQPADPRFPNGFKPLAASGAQKNTNSINTQAAVDFLELPVAEAGVYKKPNWWALFGSLDPRLRRLFEWRRSYQRYLNKELQEFKEIFDKTILENYGSREAAPLELIQRATGSTEGIVIPVQLQEEIENQYKDVEEAVTKSKVSGQEKKATLEAAKSKKLARIRKEENKIRKEILKERDAAMEVLKEEAPEVADQVQYLRDMVERLSGEVSKIVSGREGSEQLKIHIDAQLGIYLTRSYRIFSEEGWMDLVMESDGKEFVAIRDSAVRYFEDELKSKTAEQHLKKKNKKPSVAWTKLTEAEKQELAKQHAEDVLRQNPGYGISVAQEFLRSYQADSGQFNSADYSDAVDVLRQKKDLPPEIRALMGEYGEDTGEYNLMRTFFNVGNLASKQAFLNGMVDLGRTGEPEEHWLLTEAEVKERGLQDEYGLVRDIKNMPSLDKLQGTSKFDPLLNFMDEGGVSHGPLYAPKEMIEPFRAMATPKVDYTDDMDHTKITRGVSKVMHTATGLAMAAVTLGSIPFYLRNVVSNVLFFGPAQGLGVNPFRVFKEINKRFNTAEEQDEYRKKLYRRDVLGDEIPAQLFDDMLKGHATPQTAISELNTLLSKAQKFAASGSEIPKSIYERLKQLSIAVDAFYKIALFEHELKVLKKAQAHAIKVGSSEPLADTTIWTEGRLEIAAADKVKMTAQSYSQAPPLARGLQESMVGPLIAPFLRFKLEVPRIIFNTYKLGFQELGSGNAVLKRRATRRLGGMTGVLSFASVGLAEAMKKTFGVGDDEDELYREAGPAWARTHTFLYARFGEGESPVAFDLTYVNPFAMYVDAPYRMYEYFVAGREDRAGEMFLEAAVGLPFLEGQIFIKGAIEALVTGEDSRGNKIDAPGGSALANLLRRGNHMASVFYPPTGKRLAKLAAAGEEDREFNFKNWLRTPLGIAVNEGLPFKPYQLDPEKVISGISYKANQQKADTARKLAGLSFDTPMTTGAVKDLAAEYVQGFRTYAATLLDYEKTFKKIGVPEEDIESRLKNLITQDGLDYYRDTGKLRVPPLSEEMVRKLRESEEQSVRAREEKFNNALKHLTDENGDIAL